MDLLSQFTDLTVVDKLRLVEGLWDQIGQSSEYLPIPDWQKEELDRRKQLHLANPTSTTSWVEAKQVIRRGNGN